MTANKHIIKSGDTLSELANYYNTNVETLQSLNSDQIKDIDLIFSGGTLVLPTQVDLQHEVPVQKQPPLPAKHMLKRECSDLEYLHVAFVPEHPKTQKAEWIALTDDALKDIQTNAAACKKKINPSDKEQTLKGLASLGILDAFSNPLHEYFLQNDDDMKTYKKYLFERHMINKSNTSSHSFWVPSEYKDEQEEIEANYVTNIHKVNTSSSIRIDPKRVYLRQKRHLIKTIKKELTSYINELESKAQKYAQTQTIEENGYQFKFAFHKQGSFYTSDKELTSFKAMERFLKARINLGFSNSALTKESIRSSTTIQSIETLKNVYIQWQEDFNWVVSRYNMGSIQTKKNASAQLAMIKAIPHNRRELLANLFQLNICGYCIKEQVLTQAELFSGATFVDAIEFNTDHNIRLKHHISSFGFYTCEALLLRILKEVALRIKDYAELIGNSPDKSYAATLLDLSIQCTQRMELLKLEATKRAKSGSTILFCSPKRAARIVNDVPTVTQSKIALLWEEHSWKPKNYQHHIINNPKKNARSIVELFLSSEPNKPIYVLSDCSGISHDPKIGLKHNKFLTPIVTKAAKHTDAKNQTFTQAVEDLATSKPEFKILSLVKPLGTLSESLYKKELFTWYDIGGDNPIFGPKAEWAAGAQAQLFRFTSGLELGAEREIADRSLQLGTIKASASLDLFQASMAVSVKIPEGGAGKKLMIPYIVEHKQNDGTEIKIREYDAGEFQVELDAKVQGLVGVSCSLGSEIRIGAIEDDPNKGAVGLGIKGQAPARSAHVNRVVRGQTLDSGPNAKIATGVKTEAQLFAGVEFGGEIGLKVNWKEPKNSNPRVVHNPQFIPLVSTSLGFNVSAGFSTDMLFQFTYQNGKFLYIFEAKSAMGVGFGGKIAMEVSPLSFDKMFDVFLTIAKEEGFRRVAFSRQTDDDGVEKETFVRLNQILTIMVAYQLKASQVLMLPFHLITTMEKNAKVELNAPIIARYINNASPQFIERAEKLYPETLAPMLYVLSYYQTPTMWESTEDNIEEIKALMDFSSEVTASNEERILEMNQLQRQAILKLLQWICMDPTIDLLKTPKHLTISEADNRQFEEAMQRLTLGIHQNLDKARKWECYLAGITRLHEFFTKARDYQYSDKQGDYKESADIDYSKLLILMRLLGKNVSVYQQLTTRQRAQQTRHRLVAIYTCSQENHPLSIKDQLNQAGLDEKATIVPWTKGIHS